ncbi:MAG: hypothetical protein ACTHZ5_06780 [Micrococcaceae bacterium]
MKIFKKIATGLAGAGLVLGLGFAGAAPASAGTSIPWTYNAKTGLNYAFFASTNNFCIKSSNSSKSVVFHRTNGKAFQRIYANANGTQNCYQLDKFGKVKEGDKITFKLEGNGKVSSARVHI